MRLSLVIPVRNEGPAFALTLRYFLEQQRRLDLEIVVVDDASDTVVTGLPEGVRLVRHGTRQGIARSRNAGARAATGDLLVHTDGHVYFSDQALDLLAHVCDGTSIVGMRTQLVYDFGQFERRQTEAVVGPCYFGWRWTFAPEVAVSPNLAAINPHSFEVPYVGAACLAIRRELFAELGGFDEGLRGCGCFEDADLAWTAWSRGCRVRMLPQSTCFHLTSPQRELRQAGRSPLDVPRYDGSFCNALRVLQRHLPAARFQTLRAQIAARCPVSWAELPEDFVAGLLNNEVRDPNPDGRRVRSREWVARRMQGGNA